MLIFLSNTRNLFEWDKAVCVVVVQIESCTNFQITFAVTKNCQAAEKQLAVHNAVAVIKYIKKTPKYGFDTLCLVDLFQICVGGLYCVRVYMLVMKAFHKNIFNILWLNNKCTLPKLATCSIIWSSSSSFTNSLAFVVASLQKYEAD